jgi:hypothetical protein
MNEERIQQIKMKIDKIIDSDEFIDKLKDIHEALEVETNRIQKHLLNITTARYHSAHPNFPLDAKLKFLPVDNSGCFMEQPLCLIDEQNMPISDEINLVKLPTEFDQFQISNDKCELIIVDRDKVPLCEHITFKQLTSESIEFEYVDDERRTIQIIEIPSYRQMNRLIKLNVKPVSFDKLLAIEQPAGERQRQYPHSRKQVFSRSKFICCR